MMDKLDGLRSNRVRLVNIHRLILKDLMKTHDPAWRALNAVVSPSGSSIDLFAVPTVELLAATVVDVLRGTADQQGRSSGER